MTRKEDLPDTVLAPLAQGGDDEAFQILCLRHDGLVIHVATKTQRLLQSHEDRDDVLQEGRIALVYAIRAWKPDRGAKLDTLAWISISRRVRSYCLRKMAEPVILSTDSPCRSPAEDEMQDGFFGDKPCVDTTIETLPATVDLWQAISRLCRRQRTLIALLHEGRSLSDACRVMGITRPCGEHLIKTARAFIQAELGDSCDDHQQVL